MANNNTKVPPPGNLPTASVPIPGNDIKTNNADQKNFPRSISDSGSMGPTAIPPSSEQVSKEPASSSTQVSDINLNKKTESMSENATSAEVPKQVNIQPPATPQPITDNQKPGEMQQLDDTTVESLEKRSRIIRLIILIVSAIIIVGLVAAGIYIYNNWLKTATIDTAKTDQEQEEEPDDQAEVESDDRDGDGLPNDWEIKYGLNPDDGSDAAKDTDFDGLTNLEEYKYKTDPKNPDTDGDGYSDGQEVKGGFDPAGPGKLSNDTNEQTANTAFLAGNWTGAMKGTNYTFSNLSIALRSDGNLVINYIIMYNDEQIENDGLGKFEVERATSGIKSQLDMQGLAESGSGTYLLGITGAISSNNNEISGTWYIIPSKLTAPWMIQDKGTFSWKKS